MSSHREAPEIAKDPVADSTDVYAFVSPDRPNTVTLIANYIPFQAPDGGPNFYEFGDDVAYDINISNKGKGEADIIYRFHFHTRVRDPKTFLYNTGPIIEHPRHHVEPAAVLLPDPDQERQGTRCSPSSLACPPVNIGPRSTPNYADLAAQAVHKVGRRRVFAGQRADAFHVDLGSVFDLGALRPFQHLHLIPMRRHRGASTRCRASTCTRSRSRCRSRRSAAAATCPTSRSRRSAVIGVWSSASRRKSRMFDKQKGAYVGHGPWEQVSRLGNPLFNEVITPMAHKDAWNARAPKGDALFAKYVNHPELARLLPVLYPGVFPHLAAYHKTRADLNAILLTGIPNGIVPGFQNFTGTVESDMLRLNLAIPPTHSPNSLGLLGGDAAGFPNGRRVGDDVVTIELRAVAGVTIPLVDPSFTPDGAAGVLTDGTTDTNGGDQGDVPVPGRPGRWVPDQPESAVS